MRYPFEKVYEIKPILEAVIDSANLIKTIQVELASESLTKRDSSPVTVADYVSQALICKSIVENFPGEVIVAEESSEPLKKKENQYIKNLVIEYFRRVFPDTPEDKILDWIDQGMGEPGVEFWTIDPIDGTKGFLRGDQYAIALARIENGVVRLGILACPNLRLRMSEGVILDGVVAVAVNGMGAWVTMVTEKSKWFRLSVSDLKFPEEARVLSSFEPSHTNANKIDNLARLLSIRKPPIRIDSQAKYLLLAAGEGEIYVRFLSPKKPHYKEKIWDQAAGSLIVEEAGGKVTDLDGKPLDFTAGRTLARNRGILATNTALHELTMDALRRLGA